MVNAVGVGLVSYWFPCERLPDPPDTHHHQLTETYVFLCLGEIMRRPLDCYAYGLMPAMCGLSMRETLKPLSGVSASFFVDELPSTGQLTVESDRQLILSIEEQIRADYVKFTTSAEKER